MLNNKPNNNMHLFVRDATIYDSKNYNYEILAFINLAVVTLLISSMLCATSDKMKKLLEDLHHYSNIPLNAFLDSRRTQKMKVMILIMNTIYHDSLRLAVLHPTKQNKTKLNTYFFSHLIRNDASFDRYCCPDFS